MNSLNRRIILSGLLICILIILGLFLINKFKPNESQEVANTGIKKNEYENDVSIVVSAPVNEVPSVKEPAIEVSYEVMDSWEIANGGFSKIILIEKNLLSDEAMLKLGQKLSNDHARDRNSNIVVYSDRGAALLRMNSTITEENVDFYDSNYVGEYNKNPNSNIHEFTYYLDGINGDRLESIYY